MNHLHVVTSTLVADPLATRLVVALGRDALQDVLDVRPSGLVTTGHDARAVSSSLLTAGHTSTDIANAVLLQLLAPACRVREMGVSAIDDDITLLESVFAQLLDQAVDGVTGLDENHDPTGPLELGNEVGEALGADDGLSLGLVLEKVRDLLDGPVEGDDGVSMIGCVEDEVLAHNLQGYEVSIIEMQLHIAINDEQLDSQRGQ